MSLFYASAHLPKTIQTLKSYITHRLFYPLEDVSSNHCNSAHPFTHPVKPQYLEHDSICIPAGWDTLGYIKALNESFDPEELFGARYPKKGEPYLGPAVGIYGKIKNPKIEEVCVLASMQLITKIKSTERDVFAEEEQAFLERLGLLVATTPESVSRASSSPDHKRDLIGDVSQRLAKLSTPPKDNPQAQNEVLANFFQSLLAKRK